MLAYILAAVLLLAPPLQAVFDLPLQLAFQGAVLAACMAALWLRGGIAPAVSAALRRAGPVLPAAALLTLLALLASPFRGYLHWEWGNFAAGLLIYLFSCALSEGERELAWRAASAAAWLLCGLGAAHVLTGGSFPASAPLTNLNALALYALLLLPRSLSGRRWPQAAALLALLLLTRSAGALLAALAAGALYLRDSGRLRGSRPLAALAVLGAAAFFLFSGGDSVSSRLAWWGAALRMAAAAPLTGFGYASYTWAHAGFLPGGVGGELSIYAHNYYLEFLAENGLPAAAAWFWFLCSSARRAAGPARYAAAAALFHSLFDFGLAVPANFWLFCFAISSPAEAPAGAPARPPAWAALPALLLAWALGALGLRGMAFARAGEEAKAALAAGGLAAAEGRLSPWLSSRLYRLPALESLGRLAAVSGEPGGRAAAALYFETALAANPRSATAWRALRRLYAAPGLEREAAGLESRRLEAFR